MYNDLGCIIQNTKGISIAHLNVRSLLPKIDQVKCIIDAIKLDVFCINESWLDDSIGEYEYEINGYQIFSKHRNRHGGGIVVYIKDSLIVMRRNDLEITDVECIWLEITMSNKNILLCSMYRPPSANASYFDNMLNMFEKACFEDKLINIIGDLNINTDYDSSQIDLIESLNCLTQLIEKYTRVTQTSKSIIDLIFTSNPECHACTGVYEITMSDHYLIYTVIENVVPKEAEKQYCEIRYRNYK